MFVISWNRVDSVIESVETDGFQQLCFPGDALATMTNGAVVNVSKVFDKIELVTLSTGQVYIGRGSDGVNYTEIFECVVCIEDPTVSDEVFERIQQDVLEMENMLMQSIDDFLNIID